ncbi:DEAD/DEAH box helicase [Haloimpatiens sp. FM7330]|uniref:DEAD/DEAH box helicase n=1 Tax=Haloimpatiens sp. FM7330 TaxID=3298610 RepID=UPI003625C4FD
MSYFEANYDSVRYPYETEYKKGLRKSQIGAIHAIASHFTTSETPAIITMPTGSGKTAILILSAFILRANRVLVLTPSRLVRKQIKDDFSLLKTLLDINALVDIHEKPKVYELCNKITSQEQWEKLREYDVVVATPMSISPVIEGIPNPPYDLFDLILFDEAHHSPADTWNKLTQIFSKALKILFTATPYRRDKKEIKGKFIYNYSISDAFNDGVFGKIEYIPVTSESENADISIAKKAEEIFSQDKINGFKHYIMVRTDTNKRADELVEIYRKNTNLKLELINSKHSYKHIKEVINMLYKGEVDGVICVNMLGEGFNFPNLKIAAIHSPHKSLEVTLQFIGRFARTNASDIGVAKFIALPSEIEIECEKLFEEGAVWQDIITNLSENKVNEEIELRETIDTFKCILNKDDETKDLSLLSLTPFTHVRIYSIDDFKINSEIDFGKNIVVVNKHVSEEHSTVVLLTKEIKNPKWTNLNMFQKIQYDLFVIYYDRANKLLFINATIKTEEIYKTIAEAYTKSIPKRLPISKINKVLANLKNTEFFNIGMRNGVQSSNTESYRIISGSNAQKAIRKTDGRIYHRGHCFGKGIGENGEITVGYSSGSKVWSNSYLSIPMFLKWCKYIASKINSKVVVKTNSALDFLPISEEVTSFPKGTVISADWNKETYIKPPIIKCKNDIENLPHIQLLDTELEIISSTNELLVIALKHKYFKFKIKFSLNDTKYFACSDENINNFYIVKMFDEITLLQYLNENPLTLYFNDFSSLVGNEYYRKNYVEPILINQDILETINWLDKGVDITKEFGKVATGKQSIQEYLNLYLIEKDLNFIYYDHGTGEIADFITAKIYETHITIQLYHCKGAGGKSPGDRVGDVYEVCGQVVKSTLWTELKRLKSKLRDRMKSHDDSNDNPGNYKRDSYEKFLEIINLGETMAIYFEIVLVQPGISKLGMSEKISSVIASADDFCINQGYEHIKVLCSP